VDYTNTTGIKPGYQMAFDKDGDGGFDGFLVGEPDAYGMKWWDNSGFLTPKDASLAGCDYKICATLDDISAAYPQTKISAIGFSLGSGVKGDGVLSSLTFLDTTYTFGLEPRGQRWPSRHRGQVGCRLAYQCRHGHSVDRHGDQQRPERSWAVQRIRRDPGL